MPQSSVIYAPAGGYEGQPASHSLQEIRGALQEFNVAIGAAPIYPGRVCVAGTNPTDIILPAGTGGKVRGIAVLNDTWDISEYDLIHSTGNYAPGYFAGYPISLLTFGDIWVYSENAVAIGDPVYFRHTAGTAPNNVIGRFSNATATGFDLYPNARWLDPLAGAGLARINIGGF